MRLLTFEHEGREALGIRLNDEIVDLSEAAPDLPRTMVGLFASGPDGLAHAHTAALASRKRIPLPQIRHRVPLIPDKNIGLGLNYLTHIREMDPNFEAPVFPGMFLRAPSSMVAHNEPIIRTRISDTLDYEGELAVIIGRPGRHIPIERALDYVGGYVCHNDGSVREYNQWPHSITAGKNFDRTGGLGPEIVTADELPPGCKGMGLVTKVNGELRQSESFDNMHWSVAQLIHLMSRMMRLLPGDIVTTGTPPGVAAGFKPPKYLKHGDRVEVTIEGIGTLVNTIEDEPADNAE